MDSRSIHCRRRRPHIIGSLNPAGCLMPPSGKKGGSRRISDDSTSCPRFLSAVDCPASPKIGCMGQISWSRKPSLPFTPVSSRGASKLLKFSRLLSGRGFSSPQSVMSNRDCSSLRKSRSQRVGDEVCVADMDPPLPVVRRNTDKDVEQGSIWSRRRCGVQALGGLQLQKQQQICIGRTAV